MAWSIRILGALAALTLAGCGADERAAAPPTSQAAATAAPSPDVVPPSHGRLGPATTADDAGVVELSPGGIPDLAPSDEPEQRAGVGAAAACATPELDPLVGSPS